MTPSRFHSVFGNKTHVVLPVIHVENRDQAVRNVEVARTAGADGVFLINHSISSRLLLEIAREVHRLYPDFWSGVNGLDLMPWEVFDCVDPTISGVWVDNAGIEENSEPQDFADTTRTARDKSGWKGLYFGGVAFKYQKRVDDLEAAARIATAYMDVVTTSGPGTGMAADPEKPSALKRGTGPIPLGRVFKMHLPVCWPKQAGASFLPGHVFRRNMRPRRASPPPVLAGAYRQSHFENTG